MGTYYYSLRTKSRRLAIGGQKQDVYPVEFAYKHEPKHFRLTQARMLAAWDRRDPPAYIVWGGFEEGNNVYRRWPKGVVTASEYIVDSLEFVGILISNGRGGFTVQEWTSIDVCTMPICDNPNQQSHIRAKALVDIGLDPQAFRVYIRQTMLGNDPSMVVAVFLNPNDAVIGRVVLA